MVEIKKEKIILLAILCSTLIFFLLISLSKISAINLNLDNPNDPLGIGVNPDNILENPEQGAAFLSKGWNGLITGNGTIGKTHRYLLNHQSIFNFIFAQNYNINLLFLWTVIVWVFILLISDDIYRALSLSKFSLNILLAFVTAWGLAHLTIIYWIVAIGIKLISKVDSGVLRFSIGIAIFVLLVLINSFAERITLSLLASIKERRQKAAIRRSENAAENAEKALALAEKEKANAERAVEIAEEARERVEELESKPDVTEETRDEYEALIEEAKARAKKAEEAAEEAKERAEQAEAEAQKAKEKSTEVEETSEESSDKSNARIAELEEKVEEVQETAEDAKKGVKKVKKKLKSLSKSKSGAQKYEERLKEIVKQEKELLDARLKK